VDGETPWRFDFRAPDYARVFRQRIEALKRIRLDPDSLPAIKRYYRDHPADFISDWGCTYDPRNVEVGQPPLIPFVLYPRQREWIDWVMRHWNERSPGITEKSREVGVSWVSISLACTLCLFNRGMSIGFGSYLKEYVDMTGEMKSIFAKGRMFMAYLPPELNGGWDQANDAPYMRMNFHSMESSIGGQVGDEIGRGDRRAIYFVDESAHLEHPERVDAALSMTTNCRIDMSSVNGRANSFAERRFSGKIDVFTFHWRDDPRKDEEWYRKKCEDIASPVIVAQELDLDYSASVAGVLIPSAWVQAAVDAHVKLGITPSGARTAALDVADEGRDLNAICGAHGIVVELLDEWSGAGGDIYETVQRAFGLCEQGSYSTLRYDADGLGAGVRGDARVINSLTRQGRPALIIEAFRGSGEVLSPDAEDVKGRINSDFFANAKAQAWWSLRTRFQNTHRAVTEGMTIVDRDALISLPSGLPFLQKLCVELMQPTYHLNPAGKIIVDKSPSGASSPNLADAVMIRFAQTHAPMTISSELLQRSAMPMRRRAW
jgi:phage terminase large subunit